MEKEKRQRNYFSNIYEINRKFWFCQNKVKSQVRMIVINGYHRERMVNVVTICI